MKRIVVVLLLLAVVGTCRAEMICFETSPTGAMISGVSEEDIIKALELAVKHTGLENSTEIPFMGSSNYVLLAPSGETKAQKMRREAMENLESKEKEAGRIEQHDKDVQIIRDTLKRLKGGK